MNQFYSLIEHLHFYTLTEYFWKCDAIIWVSFKILKSLFRMADSSNLKINELSNVERPKLRDTTIENES